VKRVHVGWLPVVALALVTLGGCGTGATLDVRYREESARPAVLALAPPRRVAVGPVADRRVDASRIGSWPKDDGAIVTRRPVGEIVHGAIVAELTKNGHAIVSETPDLAVAAAVEAFSLDTMRSYPGRQYLGRVVMVVTVMDARNGSTLLSRRFIGTKRRLVDGTSEQAAVDVMDAALARAIHDFATDPQLVAVLTRPPGTAPA
jgi:hypothetical protein